MAINTVCSSSLAIICSQFCDIAIGTLKSFYVGTTMSSALQIRVLLVDILCSHDVFLTDHKKAFSLV